MHDVHEFDFIKLVHPNHPAALATSRTCFATETGSVSRCFDRKFFGIDDLLTKQIRDRHLSRRNEEMLIVLDAVHVVFEFRKLAGSIHAIAIHDHGRRDFIVAVLIGVQI